MSGPNPSAWSSPKQEPNTSVWASSAPERELHPLSDRLNLLWKIAQFNPDNPEDELMKAVRAASKQGVPGGGYGMLANIGEDVMKLGQAVGRFLDPRPSAIVEQFSKTIKRAQGKDEKYNQFSKAIKEMTIGDLLGGAVGGAAGIVTDPIEAVTGVGSRGGELQTLTGEEREAAIKSTAANILGLAAGLGTRMAVEAAQATKAAKTLESVATGAGAKALGRKTAEGALKRQLVKGAAEAGVGGAVYTGVAESGDPDVVGKALATGFLFAPLGAMMERAGLAGKSTDAIGAAAQKRAGQIAQLRTLQATSEDTFYGLSAKEHAVETADDLAEAILSAKLEKPGKDNFIVPGVTADGISRLTQPVEKGMVTRLYQREDGLFDIAVIRQGGKQAARTFDETGYLPDEIVSYNGTDYEVVGVRAGDKIAIDPVGMVRGARKIVPRNEIRRNPEQLQTVFHGTPYVFDEFDPTKFNPKSLVGPGVYVADRPVSAITRYAEGATAGGKSIRADITYLEQAIADTEIKLKTLSGKGFGPNHIIIQQLKELLESDETQLAYLQDQLARRPQEAPNIRIAHIAKKDLLDYDGPVTPEQFDKIRQQAQKEGYVFVTKDGKEDWTFQYRDGADAYDFIKQIVGGYDLKKANAFLQRAGFKGIRYDGGTRLGGGLETYNAYNIFDPKDVRPGYKDIYQPYGERPENFDKLVHDDFVSTVPDWEQKPFTQSLNEFMRARGFPRSELPLIDDAITRQLTKELADADPEIKDIFSQKRDYEAERVLDQAELVRTANSNDLTIDIEDAGQLTIRDRFGYKLGNFSSNTEALDFINKLPQSRGVGLLDGANGVPPRFGSGILSTAPDTPRPWEAPYTLNTRNFGEGLSDALNTGFHWGTQPITVMESWDKKVGSALARRLAYPGQQAFLKFAAAILEPSKRLQAILEPVVKSNSARREAIGGYIEAMNPVADATQLESAVAAQAVRSGVDITNVMRYNHAISRAAEADLTPVELEAIARKLQDEYHIDADALKIAGLMSGNARPGVVAKLTREATRGQTPALTPAEVKAAIELDKLQKDLGEAELINSILTHARLYTDGDMVAAAKAFNAPKEMQDFLFNGFRFGDIDSYQTDPFQVTLRIIRAQGKAAHLNEFIKEAPLIIREEAAKAGGARDMVEAIAERYVSDIQGMPSASRKAMRELIKRHNEISKWKLDEDVVHKLVTGVLQLGEASFQGARPLRAGFRDFLQPMLQHGARFDRAAANRAVTYASKGMDGFTPEMLEQLGEIPTYDIATIALADDPVSGALTGAATTAGKSLEAGNKALFHMSAQPYAYKLAAGGIYLERLKTVSDGLLKLARNEITKEKLYDDIKLETYQRPVVEEFDRLVSMGPNEFENASKFLSRSTVRENVGTFTSGNRVQWTRSELGRLWGMFGQWSQFQRAQLQQMLTRGTKKQRLSYLGKMASAQAGFAGVQAATGISMRPFYLLLGVTFAGGPVAEAAGTLYDAAFGSGAKRDIARYRIMHPTLWFPGKEAVRDILDALEMAGQGDPRSAVRAAGYRPVP